MLCKTMQVSRSSYYAWNSDQTHQVNPNKVMVEQQIVSTFQEHQCRYGSRRIVHALSKNGVQVSRYKAGKTLQTFGLKAIQPRSFIPKTTDSRHSYKVNPNLLIGRSWPTRLNEIWVGDITYIPMVGGKWSYLSVWLDLISRRVVGWDIADHMRESLAISSLRAAQAKRKVKPGTIIHTDRGGQYGGHEFRAIVKKARMIQSMSRSDNPYDNAFMESCFSRFKAELIRGRCFETIENARAEIFEYFEMYYNTKRSHSALNYNSPEEFERVVENEEVSLTGTNNRRYVIPKNDFTERGIDPLPVKHKQNGSTLPKE